ncbi:MAG TPA: hypothetical protein VJ773_09935 [Gemmatimonadales bacterium]|nr:hypothetical protein [Gemmatimonadales bacterium]
MLALVAQDPRAPDTLRLEVGSPAVDGRVYRPHRARVFVAPVWGPNLPTAESRIFSVVGREAITVEGSAWQAWRVEERRESDRRLMAVWWLVEESPYMVAGEAYLPDGRAQKFTEVALP